MGMKWHQIDQLTSQAETDALLGFSTVGPDRVAGMGMRGATGSIRMLGSNVGDTVSVTGPVSGLVTYTAVAGAPGAQQYDQSGAPAAEAASLLAAIAANQADITADIPVADTDRIFLRANMGTGALTLAESSGGARCVVQDNADEVGGDLAFAIYRRVVTAEDATAGPGGQGLVRFDPAFAAITDFTVDVLTSAANYARIGWTGAATVVTVGARQVLELDNAGGAVDILAGNVLQVTIFGRL